VLGLDSLRIHPFHGIIKVYLQPVLVDVQQKHSMCILSGMYVEDIKL
jgi:hypothetical protein